MNLDFRINQIVIHKREGMAEIVSTSLMCGKEYFNLKAHRGDGEMIYVPVDASANIIRPLMEVQEADELLQYMKSVGKVYTSNTKQRRDYYKKLLNSGEIKDYALLTVQLWIYEHSNKDIENPDMKLGVMDIDLLTKASDILMDELAIVYKKDRDKVRDFVFERIHK